MVDPDINFYAGHVMRNLLPFISQLTARSMTSSGMLSAPAADRNKGPILETLKKLLPHFQPTRVLEIASGTGIHVSYFAEQLGSGVEWQPSDIEEQYLRSISAYIKESGVHHFVRDPIKLDVSKEIQVPSVIDGIDFKPGHFHVIFCANLIHISPISCTEGLFRLSGKLLEQGGLLITYGPYAFNGSITPESNVAFDANLRRQNASWGLRDVEDLKKYGERNGLMLERIYDMPANNKTLVWKKQ